MRGRKPAPTTLKIVKGNPGKRPLNEREPHPKPELLPCPGWLKGEAKAEWERITPILYRLGLLTGLDYVALEAYCVVYGRWRQAEREIEAMGLTVETAGGREKISPAVKVAQEYQGILRSFLGEFGLTPASRTRVKGELPESDGFDF
ncbi:MAG: phage terminase small subunit P27 family [Candidatus Brocadiales bacterium]|nr:phage terminase small subunit P27 family [Candidatus Brocadiales bacterium]